MATARPSTSLPDREPSELHAEADELARRDRHLRQLGLAQDRPDANACWRERQEIEAAIEREQAADPAPSPLVLIGQGDSARELKTRCDLTLVQVMLAIAGAAVGLGVVSFVLDRLIVLIMGVI